MSETTDAVSVLCNAGRYLLDTRGIDGKRMQLTEVNKIADPSDRDAIKILLIALCAVSKAELFRMTQFGGFR